MSGGKFSVPHDRICVTLFGLLFALIGLFAVILLLSEVLLGITAVYGDDFWGTLFFIVIFTIFIVIGLSEVIRGLTLRSDPLRLKADSVGMLDTAVSGARFFYTWGFRVVLLFIVGAIFVAGLFLSSLSLSAIRWSGVRPTIWPAIFAVLLVLPTIVLVWLNLLRRHA